MSWSADVRGVGDARTEAVSDAEPVRRGAHQHGGAHSRIPLKEGKQT